jgi:hypothetical protein
VWILGTGACLVVSAYLTAFLNRRRTLPHQARLWDLGGLGVDYAMILASLGGFTITGAIFLAEIREDAGAQANADVIALFLIAFVILTGTAVTYATLRNAIQPDDAPFAMQVSHRVMYVLSTMCFFSGISLSLLGLLPMLMSINLPSVAQTFSWLLVFVLVAGGSRLGAWMHSLLGIDAVTALTQPLIALAGAAAYRFLMVPGLPSLWPSQAPLSFGMVVFAITATAFVVESSMIRMQHRDNAHRSVARLGPLLLPPLITALICAIDLVWLSLVYPV